MDWVFPEDVRGWLSAEEGAALADLATGKRVLEIGSFCGRSTVCMAQTAKAVVCIDPFDGRATSEPGSTLAEFNANIERYGVAGKVEPYRGTTSLVAPTLTADSFDLVFIDGAHDFDSVTLDIAAAERLLAPGGLIAFHDYRRPIDPQVTAAVDAYLARGAMLMQTVGTVAVVKPPRKLGSGAARVLQPKVELPKPFVFLGLPSYDGTASIATCESYFLAPFRNKTCRVANARKNISFLTRCFNDLWCTALNERQRGVTHFAMIHADIVPDQHDWLDILLGELIRLDADVVSAVAPIKSEHGWTSTAVEVVPGDPWFRRRLTMAEVYDLPETFGAADVGSPLLLNTGLWVCRLDRPWCEQVCFDVGNRIYKHPTDGWKAQDVSEDWLFSAALNGMGCKLYATRKVTLNHEGGRSYPTDRPWGTVETEGALSKRETSPAQPEETAHADDQVHEGASGEGRGVCGGAGRSCAAAGVGG
jgi:predicted O-methyltransferase YrrM